MVLHSFAQQPKNVRFLDLLENFDAQTILHNLGWTLECAGRTEVCYTAHCLHNNTCFGGVFVPIIFAYQTRLTMGALGVQTGDPGALLRQQRFRLTSGSRAGCLEFNWERSESSQHEH